MIHTFTVNLRAKYRRDTLDGRPHLVVPAVMLRERVLNGSSGPIFYPAEENGRDPTIWNHMPIVVDHPKAGDAFVSARTKEWIDARRIGIILNTTHGADKKLKAECWFDEEKTKSVDKRVYDAIINNRPVETSTGLNARVEAKKGTHDNVAYKGIARDYRPDHLAVLPDQLGALPVSAGGGLFANAASLPEGVASALTRGLTEAIRVIDASFVANELSFGSTSKQLCDLLSAKYGDRGRYWEGYIREVYPDFVIFSDGRGKLWRAEYTAAKDLVTLKGEATEVVQVVTYKTADGRTYTRNQTGDTTTITNAEPPMAFDKNVHLTALIGNGGYTEADRPWLSAMPDDALAKVRPIVNAAPPPAPVPAAGLTAEQVAAIVGPIVANSLAAVGLDAGGVSVLNQGKKAIETQKKVLTERIKANPHNKFSDAALANMDPDTLAGIAGSIPPVADPVMGNGIFVEGFDPAEVFAGAAAPPPSLTAANAAPPEAAKGGLEVPKLTFEKPTK